MAGRRFFLDSDLPGRRIRSMTRSSWSRSCYTKYVLCPIDSLSKALDDIHHTQLTHNVHGPHDDKFYKFLAGLEDEYAALKRSGYSGEGFFTPGQRLGVGVSHNLPPRLAKAKALEAAERRRAMAGILGDGGGQRLGGRGGPVNPRQIRELAAQVILLKIY